MLPPRSLQITLSRQSHDENWVCNLSINPLFFFFSLIWNAEYLLIFFFKLATWKQKKLPWKLPVWFLVTTRPFCINWEWKHNDTLPKVRMLPSGRHSSAGRLWLHGNHGFVAFCGWAPMEKFHTDKLTKTLPSPIYDWRLLEIRFAFYLTTEGCNKRVSIYSLIMFSTFSLPLLPLFLKENVWILLIP